MKVLEREDDLTYKVIAEERIRIQLDNGDEFDLSQDNEGFLIVNKIEGSINIKPQYSNQITIN